MNGIGYIYKTTNLVNGKVYIGQRFGNKKIRGLYLGSGVLIKKAIRKYGRNSFKREIVAYSQDHKKLDELEIAIIAEYRRIFGKDNIYNLDSGGAGNHTLTNKGLHWKHSPETIDKLRKPKSEIHKKHLRESWKNRVNVPHREDCKCASCLSKKHIFIHKDNCQCASCKTKRKERPHHKIGCKCVICTQVKRDINV
jgi:hypothetical protein